jgi:hypothetical protein
MGYFDSECQYWINDGSGTQVAYQGTAFLDLEYIVPASEIEWFELIDPLTDESLDLAFVITGGPLGTVHNLDTDEWFTTIQKGVDDADTDDGDTLECHPPLLDIFPTGKYDENVDVYKELTIIANETAAPTFGPIIVDGNQLGPCFTINADFVTIDGFHIINGTEGIVATPVNDGGTFKNNLFYDHIYAGILFIDSWGNLVDNNEFFDHPTGIDNYVGYYNTISNNDFHDLDLGISIMESSDVDVHDNYFYDNPIGVELGNNFVDTNYINMNYFGRWCTAPNIAIINHDDGFIPDCRLNWYKHTAVQVE